MPLQGDQRALLQLLCERGQSYEDIAGLLGGTAADARERARAALTELGGADPDAEVGLTDYLLGQADPIGRADAVRHLQADPEALDLATRIETALRLIAPAAKLPKLPEPRGKRRRAAVPAAGDDAGTPSRTGDPNQIEALPLGARSQRSNRQSALFAGLGAGALILLVAILAITGTFSSDDSGDEAPAATTADLTGPTGSTSQPTGEASNITTVDLRPVGDSGVAGTAKFGVVANSQLYVDIVVDGLDPKAPRSSAYFAWLMIGDAAGYPLQNPLVPDENGRFSGRLAVSAAVASTVAGEAGSVKVSLSPIRDLAEEAEQAAEEQRPVVPFTGEELAAGDIPLADPAQP